MPGGLTFDASGGARGEHPATGIFSCRFLLQPARLAYRCIVRIVAWSEGGKSRYSDWAIAF